MNYDAGDDDDGDGDGAQWWLEKTKQKLICIWNGRKYNNISVGKHCYIRNLCFLIVVLCKPFDS